MQFDITAKDIHKYMEKMGWVFEKFSDYLNRAKNPIYGEEIFLLVPVDEKSDDYSLRVKQILHSLSIIQNVDENSLYQQIKMMNFDVLKFRFSSNKIRNNAFPLKDYPTIANNLSKLIKFATCTFYEFKPFYTKAFGIAEDLTNHCFIGQTEAGSFTFSIQIPLLIGFSAVERRTENKEKLKFIGRKTIIRLLNGLKECNNIRYNNKESFSQTFEVLNNKLSKNVFDNLSEMMINNEGFNIEINAIFDKTHKDYLKEIDPIFIKANEDYEKFRIWSEFLQKTVDSLKKTIEGPIISMVKNLDDPKNIFCTIIIANKEDNKNVHISFNLNSKEYATAIKAFEKNLDVKSIGILIKNEEINRWSLEDVSLFHMQEKIDTYLKTHK